MARIRTIKPEFWDSPHTAKASAVARLTYIAMWNWADDHGRGTCNPKELEGFIFPNDDIKELSGGTSENFRQVLKEVSECFAVTFYEVENRPYYLLKNFDKHQRTERAAKPRYPGPEEGVILDSPGGKPVSTPTEGTSDDFRRKAKETPTASGTGTGEQGNRGTGEQGQARADADAPKRSPKTRAHTIPADWQPSDNHKERAKKDHLNLDMEADRFRNHAEAKGLTYKNWDAAFNNWLIKAVEFRDRDNPKTISADLTPEQVMNAHMYR